MAFFSRKTLKGLISKTATATQPSYDRNYLEYLKKNNLYTLDLLPRTVRPVAMQNLIDVTELAYKKQFAQAAVYMKANVHAAINNPSIYQKLVSSKLMLQQLKTDPSFCEQSIIENLAEFKPSGQYAPYALEPVPI